MAALLGVAIGTTAALLLRARHIADRERLEAQLRDTCEQLGALQRSSAAAALSASIAHELNQPLSALRSYADAAVRWADREPANLAEIRLALAGITESVGHTHAIIQHVRGLVRGAPAALAPLDLGGLVGETCALLRRAAIDSGGEIIVSAAPGPVIVDGDPVLLRQVLTNLVVNALQAMDQLRPAERRVTVEVRPASHAAEIRIVDAGPGLAGQAGEAAFRTFFTTKPDGMGLGLAICRAAVERHGGTVTLENGPTGGAVATVTLPYAAGGRSADASRGAAPVPMRQAVDTA